MEIKNLIKEYIPNYPIEKLQLWSKNPKKESPEGLERLKRKMQSGTVKPLAVDSRDRSTVLDGNQRLKNLIKLGVTKYPIYIIEVLSDEDAVDKALKIETNDVMMDKEMVIELTKDTGVILEDYMIVTDEISLDEMVNGIDMMGLEEKSDEDFMKDYEQPEHKILRCPKCQHEDRSEHFKIVS